MWARLLRCFIAVTLMLSLSLPFAAGQNGLPSVERGVGTEATGDSDKSGSGTSALPYFVMAIYTMLVLTIVCMPSRKA